MEKDKLIIKILRIASQYGLSDEITMSVAENFIKKYTIAEIIEIDIAETIQKRIELICSDAQVCRGFYNHIISSLA